MVIFWLGLGNPLHIGTKSPFCMVVVLVLKSWDWVRPAPPSLGENPNFDRKFLLNAPLSWEYDLSTTQLKVLHCPTNYTRIFDNTWYILEIPLESKQTENIKILNYTIPEQYANEIAPYSQKFWLIRNSPNCSNSDFTFWWIFF